MPLRLVLCLVLSMLVVFDPTSLLAQEPAAPSAVPARLTLGMATEILLANNPALLKERQNIVIARGNLIEARLLPNPTFEIRSESYPIFEDHPGAFFNNQELNILAGQTILTAGKRRKRTAVAQQDVAVTNSSLQDVIRQLTLELKNRYFSVSLAKSQLGLAQQILSEYDKVIKINEARYKEGEISGFEFSRLQTERLRFFNDQVEAELQLKNSKVALLELLGADPSAIDFDVAEELAFVPVPVEIQSLQEQAEMNRPDLAAQKQRVERELRQKGLQQSLAVPDVTPAFGYKRDLGANTVAFGVSLPLPLFNRNQGGIARAGAQLEQQRQDLTRVQLAVRRGVQEAVNGVQAQIQRVQAMESTYVPNARRARDIAQASYRLGALDLIGFLDVERSYRETLRTYNQALYEYRVSLSQLEAAIGKDITR